MVLKKPVEEEVLDLDGREKSGPLDVEIRRLLKHLEKPRREL